MKVLLGVLMGCLLVRSGETMAAAAGACRLFVTAVMPGLFPYMVLSLMLVSRFGGKLPGWGVMLLGWGGGSPTGARLLVMMDVPRRERVRLLLVTATMSPMFLLGTVGAWLRSPGAGVVVLLSVLMGGGVTGWLASRFVGDVPAVDAPSAPAARPLSFGEAIDQASRTMLLVCGTMVMWRVFASLLTGVLPEGLLLPLITVMEVTTGTARIAETSWPLMWRTALIAGATGFGGMAILMQNRAVGGSSMPLWGQVAGQAVHGIVSFLLALGMMTLLT